MTNDLIEALIRANLAGSAAILAVLVMRWPLRRLAGARLAYALWLLVPVIVVAAFLPAREVFIQAQPLATDPMAAAPVAAPGSYGSAPIRTATPIDPTV